MKKSYILIFGLFLFVLACVSDSIERDQLDLDLMTAVRNTAPTNALSYYVLPKSTNLEAIPQDPANKLTPEKVELGAFLFFETGMGIVPTKEVGMQSYSCSSCHVPAADFKPGRRQGIGEGGSGFGFKGESRVKHGDYEEMEMDVQGIRPLTVLNVAYSAENTLWSGAFGSGGANAELEDIWGVYEPATELNHLGYQGLETQNIEGLKIHRLMMTPALAEELGYTTYFDEAFPDFPEEERYSNVTTSFAISAYLRTLITDDAPFQKWLKGDMGAMSNEEKRGALLFFGDANCYACHTNPAFSATRFFALGVDDMDDQVSFNETAESKKKNLGRGSFTGRAEDMFKFKVPTLYNLAGTSFYFHGSSKSSLEEVVEFFDRAVPENSDVPASAIASDFRPLNLTAEEKADLVIFLKFGLDDPTVEEYMPTSLPSGNCYPNADVASKRDLQCE